MELSETWLYINKVFKFVYFVIPKIYSYNEELFLYNLYIVLFVILCVNIVETCRIILIYLTFDFLKFYEDLAYLKSVLLFWIKNNYILLKKCAATRSYLQLSFIKLFIKSSDLEKIFKERLDELNLINYYTLYKKSNKLKKKKN